MNNFGILKFLEMVLVTGGMVLFWKLLWYVPFRTNLGATVRIRKVNGQFQLFVSRVWGRYAKWVLGRGDRIVSIDGVAMSADTVWLLRFIAAGACNEPQGEPAEVELILPDGTGKQYGLQRLPYD